MFLALVAQLRWKVYQFDVKLVFLNGELEEEVYVFQPKGFVISGKKEKVYRLRKVLYGLKQAHEHGITRLMNTFDKMALQEVKMSLHCITRSKVSLISS